MFLFACDDFIQLHSRVYLFFLLLLLLFDVASPFCYCVCYMRGVPISNILTCYTVPVFDSSCYVFQKGGGTIDLEPCLTHTSTVEPTLAPVAVERTMTTRAAASV